MPPIHHWGGLGKVQVRESAVFVSLWSVRASGTSRIPVQFGVSAERQRGGEEEKVFFRSHVLHIVTYCLGKGLPHGNLMKQLSEMIDLSLFIFLYWR